MIPHLYEPLHFTVLGTPRPQGSKRGVRNKHSGKVILLEMSEHLPVWREAVKEAAAYAMRGRDMFTGSVLVKMTFRFLRPNNHWLPVNSRRARPELRQGMPHYPTGKPDLSKLVRSTEDAMTDAGVWRDDAQVARLEVVKRYALTAGADVVVASIEHLNRETILAHPKLPPGVVTLSPAPGDAPLPGGD